MMVPKRQTVSLVGLVIVAQLLTFNRSAPTVSFHKTLQDIQGLWRQSVKSISPSQRSNSVLVDVLQSTLPANFGIDRIVAFTNAVANVMNYNSNNDRLNRFVESFSNTFNSPGLNNFNNFYLTQANVLTVIDAVANVVRVIEGRKITRRDRVELLNAVDPLVTLKETFDATNDNLADISVLVGALACGLTGDDGVASPPCSKLDGTPLAEVPSPNQIVPSNELLLKDEEVNLSIMKAPSHTKYSLDSWNAQSPTFKRPTPPPVLNYRPNTEQRYKPQSNSNGQKQEKNQPSQLQPTRDAPIEYGFKPMASKNQEQNRVPIDSSTPNSSIRTTSTPLPITTMPSTPISMKLASIRRLDLLQAPSQVRRQG